MERPALALVLALLVASRAGAQEMRVTPYVQDATPRSAWILWETTSGEESRVLFGLSEALGETSTGSSQIGAGSHRLHEVQLSGLSPATRYYYRVLTGALSSEVFHFTTPPTRDAAVTFRMVAVSDMQIDRANPTVYRSLIHQGIIDLVTAEVGPELDAAIAFALVPGDLVDDGSIYESWLDEFLGPGADIMAYVPFYPVLGNHERNSEHYYRYFHLPDNGSVTSPERWWSMDYANVRVIGLDSNLVLLTGEQQRFLESRLVEACSDEAIDFVLVEMHHAHRSELWPAGEIRFSTQVVERMNRFSEECDRPSVHFHGHTHGYARGESRDAAHLWVNVASAGGNIDYWGEYGNQRDVPELSVSQDEWGFVIVEVTSGDDPSFHLRRISRGNEAEPRDNEVRDEIVIRRRNAAPAAPVARMPRGRVVRACNTLVAGPFSDPDGDEHGATHWQVAESCEDFEAPVIERYRVLENWYEGADLQAGDDLSDEPIEGLAGGAYYCWRARYRDRGLAWSAWSTPSAFLFDESGAGVADGCDDPSPLERPSPTDAGPPVAPSTGCGCRAAGSAPPTGSIAWALAAIGCLALRRGSRSRRTRSENWRSRAEREPGRPCPPRRNQRSPSARSSHSRRSSMTSLALVSCSISWRPPS